MMIEQTPGPVTNAGKGTILVVDDEPGLRDLVRMILEWEGYEVLEAASGPEALQVWEARAAQVNLVITDLYMPGGFDGPELARQLLARQPAIKIILTTGQPGETDEGDHPENLARAVGGALLRKPFGHPQLLQSIGACLERR